MAVPIASSATNFGQRCRACPRGIGALAGGGIGALAEGGIGALAEGVSVDEENSLLTVEGISEIAAVNLPATFPSKKPIKAEIVRSNKYFSYRVAYRSTSRGSASTPSRFCAKYLAIFSEIKSLF
jgi:hypothetical protein